MDSNKGEFQYEFCNFRNHKKPSELESLESWRDRAIKRGALVALAEGEILVIAQDGRMAAEIMREVGRDVNREGRPFKIWLPGRKDKFGYMRGARKEST